MSASSLWVRIGAIWLTAAVLLLLVAVPAPPGPGWGRAVAGATGTLGGVLLFLGLGGCRHLPLRRPRGPTAAVLFVTAGAEEVVWRRFALAELALRVGAVPALGATTVAFALAHGEAAGRQLVTGAAFGLLYLGTGNLAAPWCAHAAYNLCVAAARTAADP